MQSPIALSMIAAYLIGTTLVGMYMLRRTRAGDDWAVASGQMGVLMIAVGIAGTRVGGAATYGVAGDVITGGVWSMWYAVNTFLALALLGIFYAVPYRRLGIQTVGEVFLQRFNSRRCQWLTSLCVQMEYLIVNIIEPYVIGRILTAMTGLPFGFTVLLSGVIIVTYTSMGGIWGSAATNLIHCIAILGGLTAVALAGLNHLGGWSQVSAAVDAALAAGGSDAIGMVVDCGCGLAARHWNVLRGDAAHAGRLGLLQLRRGRSQRARRAQRVHLGRHHCHAHAVSRRHHRHSDVGQVRRQRPARELSNVDPTGDRYQSMDRRNCACSGSGGGGVIGRTDSAVERDDVRARLDSRIEILDAGSAAARVSLDDHHLRYGRRDDRVAWPDHIHPGAAACSGSRWWCLRRSR